VLGAAFFARFSSDGTREADRNSVPRKPNVESFAREEISAKSTRSRVRVDAKSGAPLSSRSFAQFRLR
jgi:hypothetical protein